ncbi:HalOD1 output domain-containing protein [Natronococcus jeotgali]|uniref:HalOD1 output domain-containing protein n=1 Tax=Natronococcus jeotgali TaxID=413812 RepID=UPI0009FC2152|nr:HalOD1 output domain-containing protein [Natronococcus jeotgali]
MAVIRAVSALNGCEPCSMRPLTDVVDPDALDALFAERNDEKPRLGGRISFVYEHCRITVDNGEYLTVRSLRIQPWPAGDGAPDGADAQ